MSQNTAINSTGKRVALITGAATGIGRAIAVRLAADGFFVVINYKNALAETYANSIRKELINLGQECYPIKADITRKREVKSMIMEIQKKIGKIDILVNNAGINQTADFTSLVFDEFDKVMNTNLRGSAMVTQYAIPLLMKSASPRIIFISSVNSFIGSVARSAYVTSKTAILGLVKALALELAPKILVNAVAPGYIDTEMFRKFTVESKASKIKKIPLRRIGFPSDVACTVSFLCSDDSSYITGQCIHVNGGVYLN